MVSLFLPQKKKKIQVNVSDSQILHNLPLYYFPGLILLLFPMGILLYGLTDLFLFPKHLLYFYSLVTKFVSLRMSSLLLTKISPPF